MIRRFCLKFILLTNIAVALRLNCLLIKILHAPSPFKAQCRGVDKVPRRPRVAWGLRRSRKPPNLQGTKIYCGFFRTGVRSSGKRQCSGSVLRALGVTWQFIGGSDYRFAGQGGVRGTFIYATGTVVYIPPALTLRNSGQCPNSLFMYSLYDCHIELGLCPHTALTGWSLSRKHNSFEFVSVI
jgi:hypothetical protein